MYIVGLYVETSANGLSAISICQVKDIWDIEFDAEENSDDVVRVQGYEL
jgi:hypothetical protein